MDTKQALDEVSRIEREKAQLELRQAQLVEKQDVLAKRLAELGVSPKDLDAEVSRLEASIREKLDAIRKGPAKTQALKSRSVDEDILSAIKDE
jgi:peptidoglycan hydrolase CwlO-like protein